MATYFVASGGSNTSPYDTWAKAATSLQTALTAASSVGDKVVIQYNAVPSTDAEFGTDRTYTTAADDITIISASNDGGSAYTPTAMGSSNWIGNSTLNRWCQFNIPDKALHIWGVTVRLSGSTGDSIYLSYGTGCVTTWTNCFFWITNTSTTNTHLWLQNGKAVLRDCTYQFGSLTGQTFGCNAGTRLVLENSTLSGSGSIPVSLFSLNGAANIVARGCDFSQAIYTLVPDSGYGSEILLERCRLGVGSSMYSAQTTNPYGDTPIMTILDCHSGDTHLSYQHHQSTGSITSDTGIFFTSGVAQQSWKIVTTLYPNRSSPYVSPWIDLYWDGTSAITPYIEILRDGSSTAFTDAEVWVEIAAKTTSGYTIATFSNDRQTINSYLAGTTGSDQADGAGLGSWTGESGTAKSMKLQLGSSITPAEIGSLTARIYVAKASTTLYVDPQIRT